jgi:hypothetical protein
MREEEEHDTLAQQQETHLNPKEESSDYSHSTSIRKDEQ